MDNIIHFPTWLLDKERDLTKLEHDLIMERMYIEREKSKIKQNKEDILFKSLMCFSTGILVGAAIILLTA